MRKGLVFASLFATSLLAGCAANENERFGLEGGEASDAVTKKDSSALYSVLSTASQIEKYSYETTVSIVGSTSHFIDYFAPTCFYEENDDALLSFGYAEEKDTKSVFKYYIDGDEVRPSIYEYIGTTSGEMEKLTDLYDSFSLASLSLLAGTMDTFSASFTKGNTYVITDDETASVFQYMTTFGSSISDYMTAVYVTIEEDGSSPAFKVSVDCGDYGTIDSEFRVLEESPTDEVETLLANGSLTGVDEYPEVASFLNEAAKDDYVIEGIKIKGKTADSKPAYRIHLNQSYFYLEYLDYDASGNEIPSASYANWGYAYLKKGQAITLHKDDGTTETIGPLSYDACFGFSKTDDDSFAFDFFKGPVETDSIKYIEVDSLPAIGDSSYLYVVPNEETGEREVYEWIEIDASTGEMGYSRYSSWYEGVGAFPINDASATFYLSGTSGLTELGSHFFEKDYSSESSYYSSSYDILTMLANGLFGWGFQSTTTWMSYVTNAYLTIKSDDSGIALGGEIGLGVQASVDGGTYSEQKIVYSYDFTTSGSVSEVESFFASEGVQLS